MGPAASQFKELVMLNRTLKWSKKGITSHADPRHAQDIIKDLGLEGAKSAPTPAVRDPDAEGKEKGGKMRRGGKDRRKAWKRKDDDEVEGDEDGAKMRRGGRDKRKASKRKDDDEEEGDEGGEGKGKACEDEDEEIPQKDVKAFRSVQRSATIYQLIGLTCSLLQGRWRR